MLAPGAVLAQKFWGGLPRQPFRHRVHFIRSPVSGNEKNTNSIWAYIFPASFWIGGQQVNLGARAPCPNVEPPLTCPHTGIRYVCLMSSGGREEQFWPSTTLGPVSLGHGARPLSIKSWVVDRSAFICPSPKINPSDIWVTVTVNPKITAFFSKMVVYFLFKFCHYQSFFSYSAIETLCLCAI